MVKFYENITNETQDSINDLYNQMKNGKPCALTVYHPYCSHCMNMKPNWKAMGEHMEKKYNDELYIAFVHMDVANEFPIDQNKIQGYPHIIYTANKNEVEYNGPREVDAFESWILENLKQTNSNNNINKNVNSTALPNSVNYNNITNNKNNNNISNITNNFNSSNESQNFENSSNSNVSSHPLNKAQNSLQLYRKLLDKYSRNKNSQMTSKAQPVNKIKSVKKKNTSQKPKIKLTKNKKLSKKSMAKTKKTKSVKKSKSLKKPKSLKKTKSLKKKRTSKKPKFTKKSNTRKLKTFHDLNTL